MENKKQNEKASENLVDGVDKFLEGIERDAGYIDITTDFVKRVEFKTFDKNGEALHLMLTLDSGDQSIILSDLTVGKVICGSQDYLWAFAELINKVQEYVAAVNKEAFEKSGNKV